ncbi:MAG: hypothetical protein QNL04_08975 [SAR324 cluster bacterium]|nr:hypothetical protein [SAR324 cluster bacterium]
MLKFAQILMLSILLLFAATPAQALDKGRIDNPLQMQLNPLGGGVNLGYHFTSWMYVGVVQSNPVSFGARGMKDGGNNDNNDNMGDNMTFYGQYGHDSTSGSFSKRQAAEIRFTPWSFGAYISFGYLKYDAESFEHGFDERERTIGDNTYTTSFTINQESEAYESPTVGLGFNHVAENGVSFGIGMIAGINTVNSTSTVSGLDSSVTAADEALFQADVDTYNQSQQGGTIHAGIGYNF